MLTRPWEPMAELNRFRDEMNRLFGRYGMSQPRVGVNVFPPLNVREDDDQLYVEAELPGFDLSDLEILVTGGDQLSIKGERKQPEVKGGTWHRQERGFGRFGRMVQLPCSVDSDKVNAELTNGVLTITLPKSKAEKPRRIVVKAN